MLNTEPEFFTFCVVKKEIQEHRIVVVTQGIKKQ